MRAIIQTTILSLFVISSFALERNPKYPAHWWKKIEGDKKSWEIDPSSAKQGEVIVSKRNELGILSNFSHAPFTLDSKKYQSIEGFWQMMKYPDLQMSDDPRFNFKEFVMSRDQVSKLIAYEAKSAGKVGSKAMRDLGLDWVSYQGRKMVYYTSDKGEHYQVIRRAMEAKLKSNPKVKEILLKTGDLVLKPDHHQRETDPPAWRYCQIWMELRSKLQN